MAIPAHSVVSAIFITPFVSVIANGIIRMLPASWGAAVTSWAETHLPPPVRSGLSQIFVGVIGIITIVLWIGFRVDERIYNWWAPEPGIGTLYFDSLAAKMASQDADHAAGEVQGVLTNANTSTLYVKGHWTFVMNHEKPMGDSVDDYVLGGKNLTMTTYFNHTPLSQKSPNMQGVLQFKVSYSFPGGKRKCWIERRIIFGGVAQLNGSVFNVPTLIPNRLDRCE